MQNSSPESVAKPQKTPTTVYLKDYSPPAYLVDEIDLNFRIFDSFVSVKAQLSMRPNPDASETRCFLYGTKLKLKQIQVNGKDLSPQDYIHNDKGITLLPTEKLGGVLGSSFTLSYTVEIDPYNNVSLEGMYRSKGVLCTQNEAQGFRKIGFFPDRPDVLTRYTTTITADKAKFPVLLANGNLVEQTVEGNLHSKKYRDPAPKPCYLFALVAGDLHELKSTYTTKSGRQIVLSIFCEDDNTEKCQYAMESLQRSLLWDEEVFSLECDLDDYKIVAVDSFNFGAMENKGLNVFNSSLIFASKETTTDQEYINIEAVVAHEYFHNWSGNRITLRDWFQLTLKEGLTVYRDQEFTSDMHSRLVKRIEDVSMLREYQFSEDASPLAHPIQPSRYNQINNFYTLTIYEKGAEVIRMYRTILGDEKFMQALAVYFKRFDGMAITTEDFFAVMQESYDGDLSQFKNWYSTFGTPTISVDERWNQASQEYTATLKQKIKNNPKAAPLLIPLAFSIISVQGEVLETGLHLIDKATSKITFKSNRVLKQKPHLSINQGFSAPVIVEQNLSLEETAKRARLETDPLSRWDLLQNSFFLSYRSWQKQKTVANAQPNADLVQCLLKQLSLALDDKTLMHYSAKCFTMPSIRAMIVGEDVLDFSSIKTFRETFLGQIAIACEKELLAVYNTLKNTDSLPARALKNTALSYLQHITDTTGRKYEELIYQQFTDATNMTDCYTAFLLLTRKPGRYTEQAIKQFYKKWRHNNLVINKWFAAQAACDDEGVIATVEKLEQDPCFDLKEPNKVRALYSVFAMRNFYQFHNASGNGYRFLAKKIVALDAINPMMSANLLTAFSQYRKLVPKQQEVVKTILFETEKKLTSNHALEIVRNLLK